MRLRSLVPGGWNLNSGPSTGIGWNLKYVTLDGHALCYYDSEQHLKEKDGKSLRLSELLSVEVMPVLEEGNDVMFPFQVQSHLRRRASFGDDRWMCPLRALVFLSGESYVPCTSLF